MKAGVRHAMAISVVVQGVGSLAPLLTVIGLARVAGPEAQGAFSAFKTWLDLLSSLVVFGFPQAFVYLINKGVCSRVQLLNATFFYVAATTLLVVPAMIVSVLIGYTAVPLGQNAILYGFMVAVGLGPLFLNRLVRGIYLTIDDGFVFSLVTSAPAAFLMATTLIAGTWTPFRYDIAFAVAGVLTLLSTWPWVIRIISQSPAYRVRLEPLPFRALGEQSTQIFVQSIAFTLQPVLAIYILQQQGADITAIAFFTASTVVVVGINVLFGLVAPILFNRWSVAMDETLLRRISRYSLTSAAGFGLLGLISIPLFYLVVPTLFGPSYGSAVWAFQAMAFAVAPVAFTRCFYPAIHAGGRPALNTISCVVRLASGLSAQICLAFIGAEPLVAAIAAWVIAEWAAAFYSLWATRRLAGWVT